MPRRPTRQLYKMDLTHNGLVECRAVARGKAGVDADLMSKWFNILSYVLGTTIFVTIGLEVLLRLVAADPSYYWQFGFQFVSPNTIQNRGAGIWTYRPNAAIREVAVYGMPRAFPPGPRFTVEYDCRMKSNSLGLLQDDDVAPGTAVTIVVGNSYTAGQGGCPWFKRLQARRPQDRLVNAGLLGTGFDQWWRLVKFIRDQGLVVKRLVFIAISNDFKRGTWNWPESALACIDRHMCPMADWGWQSVAPAETEDELLKRAAVRFAGRFGQLTTVDFLWWYLKDQSFVLKFVNRARNNLLAIIKGSKTIAGIIPETETALEAFKTLGVPMKVLMVPQRDEVGLLGEKADPNAAVATLKSHGIAYSWCPLSGSDFMPNDGHPNRTGYDKLVVCVDQILNDME